MRKNMIRLINIVLVFVLCIMLLPGCNAVDDDAQGPLGNLNSFTAYTKKGEPFTQNDFADYDITLVCFFAPWSDASVYEMKHLAALSEKLPSNIAFVTVSLDLDLAESKEKMKDLNLKGITVLKDGDGDFKVMEDSIANVPTTILVDKDGNLLGDPSIGIHEDYEDYYVKTINKALKSIGKKRISLIEEPETTETEETDTDKTKQSKETGSSKEEESSDDESDSGDEESSSDDYDSEEESSDEDSGSEDEDSSDEEDDYDEDYDSDYEE